MPWVAALVPVVAGIVQSVAANRKQKKVESQIQPYQTNQQAKTAFNFTQNLAQGGFSPEAMQYLSSNIEKSSSNALNAVNRAGGTPNDVGNVLDQELQAYMKVGAQDSMQQMQNFDRYLNSLGVIGQNKDAEWADQRNLQKDALQQAAESKQQGFQNIVGGISNGLALNAQQQQMDLYKTDIASRNAQFQQLFGGSQLPSVKNQYIKTDMTGPNPEPTIGQQYLTVPPDDFYNRWAQTLN